MFRAGTKAAKEPALSSAHRGTTKLTRSARGSAANWLRIAVVSCTCAVRGRLRDAYRSSASSMSADAASSCARTSASSAAIEPPWAMLGVAACQASPTSTARPQTGMSTHTWSAGLNWTRASSVTWPRMRAWTPVTSLNWLRTRAARPGTGSWKLLAVYWPAVQ